MSLTARICTHHGAPWLVIEAAPTVEGGDPVVVYDGPLNLATKQTIKLEVDWAHERSGLDRPSLYDAVRLHQNTQRRKKGRAA